MPWQTLHFGAPPRCYSPRSVFLSLAPPYCLTNCHNCLGQTALFKQPTQPTSPAQDEIFFCGLTYYYSCLLVFYTVLSNIKGQSLTYVARCKGLQSYPSPMEGLRSNSKWSLTCLRKHLWGNFRIKASKSSWFWPRIKSLTAAVIKKGKRGAGEPDNSKLWATNDWGFSKLIYLFHLSTSKFKPCESHNHQSTSWNCYHVTLFHCSTKGPPPAW